MVATTDANRGEGDSFTTSLNEQKENVPELLRSLNNENHTHEHATAKLEAQPKVQDETIHKLRSALSASEVDRKRLEQKLEEAISHLDMVRNDNEELKGRLLRMQPTNVISDAQINQRYTDLCDDIEDWVDKHLGDTNDVVARVQAHAADSEYEKKLMQYLDFGLWKLLQGNIESQTKFLTCIIQRFVMHHILSCYAAGMSKEVTGGLNAIELQMRKSAGRGMLESAMTETKSNTCTDAERIASWRAETVRALMELPQRFKSRDQALVRISNEAWDLLQPFFPQHHDQARALSAFHERITRGAWELNRQIRSSPVDYHFEGAHVLGTETGTQGLHDADRELNVLIDADSGTKLKRSAEIHFDQTGCFARKLCIIFPALARRTPSRGILRIGKASILVKMNKRPQPTAMRRLVNSLTG